LFKAESLCRTVSAAIKGDDERLSITLTQLKAKNMPCLTEGTYFAVVSGICQLWLDITYPRA
jgi:hypothetical protein